MTANNMFTAVAGSLASFAGSSRTYYVNSSSLCKQPSWYDDLPLDEPIPLQTQIIVIDVFVLFVATSTKILRNYLKTRPLLVEFMSNPIHYSLSCNDFKVQSLRY
jgi:hypothetical protein